MRIEVYRGGETNRYKELSEIPEHMRPAAARALDRYLGEVCHNLTESRTYIARHHGYVGARITIQGQRGRNWFTNKPARGGLKSSFGF